MPLPTKLYERPAQDCARDAERTDHPKHRWIDPLAQERGKLVENRERLVERASPVNLKDFSSGQSGTWRGADVVANQDVRAVRQGLRSRS
jgi:hypothetical protein